jgi:hypothetical protein
MHVQTVESESLLKAILSPEEITGKSYYYAIFPSSQIGLFYFPSFFRLLFGSLPPSLMQCVYMGPIRRIWTQFWNLV